MKSETSSQGMRDYLVVTAGYWAFTITDGAIRMLVVLYFHLLGYSAFEVAMLFVFYELFGVLTNLVGGWLGARIGLNRTMHIGMSMQIIALLALTVPESMLTVPYVMAAQALSGIAKDLNKMSAKASVKTLVSSHKNSVLFKWVAVLTGSKNTLKGAGFFIGAALLSWIGFQGALFSLAILLAIVLLITMSLLTAELGKSSSKAKFQQVFSPVMAINWLSSARFFLFGSRDIWFVVGLPVYLFEILHWNFNSIGAFMAVWIIFYGLIQASTPRLLKFKNKETAPNAHTAFLWAVILFVCPVAIALFLKTSLPVEYILIIGLALYAFVFAINSAIHSYLILSYSDHDKVAMNVGFYYMSNAAGRLTGTVLSGVLYQKYGLSACLWFSACFVICAAILTYVLAKRHPLESFDEHKSC